jgi:hypothetical protein
LTDYQIENGDLLLRPPLGPEATSRTLAQVTLLQARAQGLTVDEVVHHVIAQAARLHHGPEVSALERTVRTAVQSVLDSDWSPADSGTLS